MERGREERVWEGIWGGSNGEGEGRKSGEGIRGGSAKGYLSGHTETYYNRSFLTNKHKREKPEWNHKIMERQRPTRHLLTPSENSNARNGFHLIMLLV